MDKEDVKLGLCWCVGESVWFYSLALMERARRNYENALDTTKSIESSV